MRPVKFRRLEPLSARSSSFFAQISAFFRPSLPGPGPAHDATRESKFPPGIPLSMALDTENDLLVPVPRDIAKLFLQ